MSFTTWGFNSFKLSHQCGRIYRVHSLDDLKRAIREAQDPVILGEGSNVLFTCDTEKELVIIDLKGIRLIEEDYHSVLVEVAAGENWHNFVLWSIENEYGGVENLSLIPGKCGAAPIQNIGAYGVEIGDVLVSLSALEISTEKVVEFSNEECRFAYRESSFKSELKGKYVILSLRLRLSKAPHHKLDTAYAPLQNLLREQNILHPTIKDISEAVIEIRKSKLPDPENLPNAGSFFKNPVIDRDQFRILQLEFPEIPFYKIDENFKLPAAWLIENAGLKGFRIRDVGTHEKQALVIVNYGTSDGQDIKAFAEYVQKIILERFRIELKPEVNYIC